MVKKLTLLLLSAHAIFCFAQDSQADAKVTYRSTIIKDSLNRSKFIEYENILLYNSKESVYYSSDEKEYYKALNNRGSIATIPTTMGNIPKYPTSRGQVYRTDQTIYTTLPIGFYNYEFPEPELIWEILPDKKKIKDFVCQLAKTRTETGDTFFAWFTPEIISTEGPFRFKGLSGLILEIYNKSRTIEIAAIEISISPEIIEKIPYVKLLKIENKNKFFQVRKNFFENPSIYMGNMQIFDSNGSDITRKKMDRYKRENVFLD